MLNANAIWVKAPVVEHAFVVNTGSYFELISGGRWKSTVHRVCARVRVHSGTLCARLTISQANTDRTSLPFFFSPSPNTTIYPMVALEDNDLEDQCRDIGKEHVRGMMADRPNHPFVKKLRALGLGPEEYTYDMILQPIA